MLKIGLTGNIGSGKTTVAKVFELLGVPVFYADDAAKTVMINDKTLIEAIKTTFGTEAYFADGSLNRKHISAIVFNDKNELQKLNALVHPAVFRAFDNWVLQNTDAPYVIKEAAILFESDSYKKCDRTLVVTAPLDIRIARTMTRDGLSKKDIEDREARQLLQDKKIVLADNVIINDDKQLIIPQILELHRLYLSLAKN